MIRVNEVFYSIQGEGAFAGRPAAFIRLQGCGVGCTFCDTKHTWEAKKATEVSKDRILGDRMVTAESWANVTEEELCSWVHRETHHSAIVVITGGEPLIQRDGVTRLVLLLVTMGRQVQIETSGTVVHPLLDNADPYVGQNPWVTVSPKWEGKLLVHDAVLQQADEVKVVVSSDAVVAELEAAIVRGAVQPTKVRLQPETGENFDWSVARAVELCKRHGFQLSLQTHTFLHIR